MVGLVNAELLGILVAPLIVLLVGLAIYHSGVQLEQRSAMVDEESPEDLVQFYYRGEIFKMTREQKEEWDSLLPEHKKLIQKNLRKSKFAQNQVIPSDLDKFKNREVWLKD